jgi:hypothetical protein
MPPSPLARPTTTSIPIDRQFDVLGRERIPLARRRSPCAPLPAQAPHSRKRRCHSIIKRTLTDQTQAVQRAWGPGGLLLRKADDNSVVR